MEVVKSVTPTQNLKKMMKRIRSAMGEPITNATPSPDQLQEEFLSAVENGDPQCTLLSLFNGLTCLFCHLSCLSVGDRDVIAKTIALGADVNYPIADFYNETPLMMATRLDVVDSVEFLLGIHPRIHVDVNHQDEVSIFFL